MARRSSRTDLLWSHMRDNCLRNFVVSYDTRVSLLGLRLTRWNCFTSMCDGMKMDKEFFECGSGGIMHGVHSINFRLLHEGQKKMIEKGGGGKGGGKKGGGKVTTCDFHFYWDHLEWRRQDRLEREAREDVTCIFFHFSR